ncbi:hypothetical protein TPHA_0B01560 [Tetrapisispora phaffii CBS 4417]|uniref:Arrestin C-terminal-like domain-containing protein n=1 Tax=Tetrapisispora phaffii (strain ATCC 24235 / CBS 4417 / NBRC 1672 / NRRL Y-8282 / UCD 70-5) TaxID=1071381 RepID=G8BP97_TETPH|nr:hypothetical protein TPHA_0B01560 [Tetrapisispora phaffii CBS 4417]CCE61828.1 hypothetical protein TPHA_0B01560 [Tetrapisispora phaffii CBS 4417]
MVNSNKHGLKNVLTSIVPNAGVQTDERDGASQLPKSAVAVNIQPPQPAMVDMSKNRLHPRSLSNSFTDEENDLSSPVSTLQPNHLKIKNRRYSTNSTPIVNNGNVNVGMYRNFDPLNEINTSAVAKIEEATRSHVEDLDDFETKRLILRRKHINDRNGKNGSVITNESFGKEFLEEYLTERGFLQPKVITTDVSNDLRISMASTGDCVFLPTVSTTDDEYLARLHGSTEEEEIENNLSANRNLNSQQTETNDTLTNNNGGESTESTPENQSTVNSNIDIDIDDSMFSYSIAVILSLNKTMTLSDINVELCARVRIYWNEGVPPTKTFKEEIYNAGSSNWLLGIHNYNLYIPLIIDESKADDNKIIENNNINLIKGINKENGKNNSTSKETFFKVSDPYKRIYTDKLKNKKKLFEEISKSDNENVFQPGDYMFILPIIFTNNIPESIYLPSARVGYRLCVALKELDKGSALQTKKNTNPKNSTNKSTTNDGAPFAHKFNLFKKVKEQLHTNTSSASGSSNVVSNSTTDMYSEMPINIIRSPPPISISTANKSIYINRVWSKSLSYEISFGQKYVPVNNKFPIKIKLAPLTKDIKVKRVRVSIVEKITFVSKDLEYEYDQIDIVAKDPYNPYFMEFDQKRKKERNLSLLEIRTKDKGSRSIREEIIDNCIDDNILSYTEIPDEGSPKSKHKKKEVKGFNEPLTIVSQLEFPKYFDMDQKSAKLIPPYGIDLYSLETNSEKENEQPHKSGVMGFFSSRRASIISRESDKHSAAPDPRLHETKFYTNAENTVQCHTRINKAKRGLYLDSLHFSNIHCRHKLEIMLRICKPDADDSAKLRNYEVLIDIPIFLISELCNAENLELPTYEMALTTDKNPSSPVITSSLPTFEQAISVPGSPINSPFLFSVNSGNPEDERYIDDLHIQQLNLSRASSVSGESSNPHAHRTSEDLNNILTRTKTFSGDGTSKFDPRLKSSVGSNYGNLDGLLAPNVSNKQRNRATSFNHVSMPQNNIFNPNYSVGKYHDNEHAIQDDEDEDGSNNDDTVSCSTESIGSYRGETDLHEPPNYNEIIPLMSNDN